MSYRALSSASWSAALNSRPQLRYRLVEGAALLLSAVAGFGMLIWIFVELALIRHYSWLQAAYFGLGALELILVLVLLGIIPPVGSASFLQHSRVAPHVGKNKGARKTVPLLSSPLAS